jgi:predicted PolB exonuclease-like 3'-5' exonuclease
MRCPLHNPRVILTRMDKRYLVIDIETILDTTLAKQVFGLSNESTREEVQQQLLLKYPNGFAPPPYHIPICIALIDVDYETCKVCNATVIDNEEERSLLQQLWKIVKFRKGNVPIRSTLIHFNGRGFDLPVLFYRSLKHRVPVVTWERGRYTFESSHDLCDDLSDFGAVSRPSLDVVSKMLGLPGKTDVYGSQVEELYFRQERAKIRDYCMQDTLGTYYIWLTIKLIRGEIGEEKYREAFDSAAETVAECRARTENFFAS